MGFTGWDERLWLCQETAQDRPVGYVCSRYGEATVDHAQRAAGEGGAGFGPYVPHARVRSTTNIIVRARSRARVSDIRTIPSYPAFGTIVILIAFK